MIRILLVRCSVWASCALLVGAIPLHAADQTTAPPAKSVKPSRAAPKPATATTPTPVKAGSIIIPKENCGTIWTERLTDPDADVNPCPAGCERGDKLDQKEIKIGDTVQYQINYRCYWPEQIVQPLADAVLDPKAPPRTNCGTFWTPRQSSPESDANPCPEHCERGELLDVRRGRADGNVFYELWYRCYIAQPQLPSKIKRAADRAPADTTSPTSGEPRPVTDEPKGAQVAGTAQTSSSTYANESEPNIKAPAKPGQNREIDTAHVEGPGTTITAVTDIASTSLTAKWKPVAGAKSYTLHAAAKGLNHAVSKRDIPQPANPSNDMSSALTGLAPGVEHDLWVTVVYPDGRVGKSDERSANMGSAENPKDFQVKDNGPGSVFLSWQRSPDASHYVLQGSGLPRTETSELGFFVNNLPPGRYEWTLIAVYPPGVYNDLNPSRIAADVGATSSTAASPDRTGPQRYRISIAGFRVDQATNDDPLQIDGKGDEVYIAVAVAEYDASTGSLIHKEPIITSPVFGDKNGFEHTERVLVGSMSQSGGLRSGDVYPSPDPTASAREPTRFDLPLKVWEGELVSGKNALVVAPVVWEWDNGKYMYNKWEKADPTGLPLDQITVALQRPRISTVVKRIGETSFFEQGLNFLYLNGDRPVGNSPYPKDVGGGRWFAFDQALVPLGKDLIDRELAAKSGTLPTGIIPIQYKDIKNFLTLDGAYTIYLKVERLP